MAAARICRNANPDCPCINDPALSMLLQACNRRRQVALQQGSWRSLLGQEHQGFLISGHVALSARPKRKDGITCGCSAQSASPDVGMLHIERKHRHVSASASRVLTGYHGERRTLHRHLRRQVNHTAPLPISSWISCAGLHMRRCGTISSACTCSCSKCARLCGSRRRSAPRDRPAPPPKLLQVQKIK